MVGIVLLAGFYAVKRWESKHSSFELEGYEEVDEQTIYYNDKWYILNNDIETMLVIGLDKYDGYDKNVEYSNNMQSDFLLLLVRDKVKNTVTPIHINRDTMAEITQIGIGGKVLGTNKEQLALAHTYGKGDDDSCLNTAHAVSKLLYDIPIDHYLSVKMDAVSIVNDSVGGVTLTVLDDFSDINPSLVIDTEVTLKGSDALDYVRGRYGVGDETNVRRMIRQRQYVKELYGKVDSISATDPEFFADTILKLSDYIVSDCSATRLETIAKAYVECELKSTETIRGDAVKGDRFMEFHVDETALKQQVIDLFYIPTEK